MAVETAEPKTEVQDSAPERERFAVHTEEKKLYDILKRICDVVGSLLAILLLTIPMVLICGIVYLDDPKGSPIYVQKRVGKGGRPFRCYKFRSMYINAEEELEKLMDKNEMDGPAFKMKDDPRITRVGRWIRKFSMDELPQLFNILLGDMSFVGPRPPLPCEVAQYTEAQMQRLAVIPGLTCYWQITKDKNDLPFDEWVALDMKYISERSLWLDFKLIFETMFIVLGICGWKNY